MLWIRPTSGSTWISIASLLYINNQTINTYSHFVGCLTFIALPFYFYRYIYRNQEDAQAVDIFVISVYCIGVAICFAFSAM